jgi:DNA-binding transcriptional regulator YhcF (GntR family)
VLLTVDPSAPLPVYEQIRAQVATMVASGTLEPGTRLPTIRQLCDDLGIAKATVSKAYELLTRDGYVVANRRQGTVVADHPGARLGARARAQQLRAAADQFVIVGRQLGANDAESLAMVRRALSEMGRSDR